MRTGWGWAWPDAYEFLQLGVDSRVSLRLMRSIIASWIMASERLGGYGFRQGNRAAFS